MVLYRAISAASAALLLAIAFGFQAGAAAAEDQPAPIDKQHQDVTTDHESQAVSASEVTAAGGHAMTGPSSRRLKGVVLVFAVSLLNLGLGFAIRHAWPLAPRWLGDEQSAA